MGRRAAAIKCDVTDREQVAATVARAVEDFGSVDILVNNAGTLDHVAQIGDQNPELWERDLRVNLTGAFNCAQAVWPHMKERGWGRIVNMASVAGTLGGFGQASYSTTKAGLLGLTKSLALEGARHGITVNAIVPGIIGSEAFHFGNPEMNERMIKRTALRRVGEPQDIANAITFLCSDLAALHHRRRPERRAAASSSSRFERRSRSCAAPSRTMQAAVTTGAANDVYPDDPIELLDTASSDAMGAATPRAQRLHRQGRHGRRRRLAAATPATPTSPSGSSTT